MKHITILGVDGSGKSTLMNSLIPKDPSKRVCLISSPSFHEGRNPLFANLSASLEKFSNASDLFGSFELKALALYLQVSLFGPVEESFIRFWKPDLIISQRHPVLDSLVYGNLYQLYIHKELDELEVSSFMSAHLQTKEWNEVTTWFALQLERLGLSETFSSYPLYLKTLMGRPKIELIEELKRHYQTTLPDEVYIMDLDPKEALKRLQKRQEQSASGKELHENSELLHLLRNNYLQLAKTLKDLFPSIITNVIAPEDVEKLKQKMEKMI